METNEKTGMNKIKSCFFEKINTIDTLIKKQREKIQITNTRDERSGITIDSIGVERIMNNFKPIHSKTYRK